jgi:hypothetical protein
MTHPPLRTALARLGVLVALYALMLLRWGYEFGRNDQMQTLAYAEFLADPSDWPGDFYLQGVHAGIPNERYVFSLLLSPFAGHLGAVSALGHALFSLLLLGGLLRLARRWIRPEPWRWGLPLLLFIPLYGVSLGGNELWYNSFFVSNVAKVLGLGGLLALVGGRRWWAFAAAAAVTLLQPVIGIQLFGLFSGSALVERAVRGRALPWRGLLGPMALWLVTGGVWVLFLKLRFDEAPLEGVDRFFDILYVFRAPHHYWPPSWSARDWAVEGFLMLFGLGWFGRKAARTGEPGRVAALRMAGLMGTGLAALGLWTAGMVTLRPVWLGALQGGKLTIWMEMLGVLALLAATQGAGSGLGRKPWRGRATAALLAAGAVAAGLFVFAPRALPHAVPHDQTAWWGNDPAAHDDALAIARAAGAATGPEAVFAQPIGFTELKFHGRRSSWVDYKVLVHQRAAMHEWARRVALLYGLSPEAEAALPPDAPDRYARADAHYRALDPAVLAAEGITHWLTFTDAVPPALEDRVVARNGTWAVVALPDGATR